jgi:ketosteroid isomerase-like protein
MSPENVELAQRAYAAFQRRDIDAFVAMHDPACQIHPRIASIEGGDPYRGHEGVRAFVRDLLTSFPDWAPEAEEVRDFGDALIVKAHVRGHGGDSGVTIDETLWQAARVQGGRITWWAFYQSEAEALEALELSE